MKIITFVKGVEKKRYAVPENVYATALCIIKQVSVEAENKPNGFALPVVTITLDDERKLYCCSSVSISIITLLKIYGVVEITKKLSNLEKELIDADFDGMPNLPRAVRRIRYAVETKILIYDDYEESKTIARAWHGSGRNIGTAQVERICQKLNIGLTELFVYSLIT